MSFQISIAHRVLANEVTAFVKVFKTFDRNHDVVNRPGVSAAYENYRRFVENAIKLGITCSIL